MRARSVAGIALLSLSATASAAEPVPYKSPWEGFGVGSFVQFKSTMKFVAPGMAMPDDVEETRETVVQVTEDAHTIRREKKEAEEWTTTVEWPVPRKPGKAEIEELGTEKLTVEGKTFECRKVRMKYGDTTSTTWFSKTHGVLKYEAESGAGGGRTRDTRTVVALAKKVKIAGKDLVCRETKTFTKMERPDVPSGGTGDGTTGVALECDAVPGRTVRMETSGKRGPVAVSSVRELVAFSAKAP